VFTITSKIRIIVAISAVGAAVASSGVASAASVVHRPGTGTPVVASQPTTVAQYINPNNVGSAGIGGYDNPACEHLANQANAAEDGADQAAHNGDSATANTLYDLAAEKYAELEDNCLVID
jgi:hypothetical protein